MLLGGLALARLFEGLVGPVPVADQLAARRVQQVLYVTTDLGGGSPRRLGVLPDNEGRGSSRVIIVITVNMSAVHTHYTLHVSGVRAAGDKSVGYCLFLQLNFRQDSGSEPAASIFSTPGCSAMFCRRVTYSQEEDLKIKLT